MQDLKNIFNNADIVIVGSGLFGSIIAERASRNNYRVAVVEKRNHIGGNCYTEVDEETGIVVHKYGPHIFHTSNKIVWDYIRQFAEFEPYQHKAKSKIGDRVFSIPINLDTINSFFGTTLTPIEAEKFIEQKQIKNSNPQNFEEQALALIGEELYNSFMKGYVAKQWETDPKLIPASYAKRLPVRTNYSDRYYYDKWEAIPVGGYTPIFEKMLDHENIEVILDTDWFDVKHLVPKTTIVVYSGPIDKFYNYKYGRLSWRTLSFDYKKLPMKDYQGVTQMVYPDESVPWTRIIEHKHFCPNTAYSTNKTIIGVEYSKSAVGDGDEYYPINTPDDVDIYKKYRQMAVENNDIIVGRLGDYAYYDMHQVISSALDCWDNTIKKRL